MVKRIQTAQHQQEQTAHKERMYLERSVKNLKAQIRSSSKIALKYLNESCLSNGKNILSSQFSFASKLTQVGCVRTLEQ